MQENSIRVKEPDAHKAEQAILPRWLVCRKTGGPLLYQLGQRILLFFFEGRIEVERKPQFFTPLALDEGGK